MSGVAWVLRQLVRVLAGAVVVVLVLAGMPWLLLGLTRRVLADPPDLAALVDAPLSAATVVLLAVAGAWAFWGWLLVGAVLEVVERVRWPGRRRLRTPAPLYASVSAVVGTVALLLDGFAARGTLDAGPVTGDSPAATSTQAGGILDLRVQASMPGGVDLGRVGWLPLPAAAAGAVSAWIWAQRRRQYQPRPPRGAHRDDPDLLASPVRPAVDGRVTIGVAGGRWLDLADLPAGGVDLTGDGALNALRGLLVTVLTANDSGGDGPAVVVTAGQLRTLLGTDVAGVPRLHVVDDAAAVPAVGTALAAAGHRVLVVRTEAGHLPRSGRAGPTVVGVAAAASPSSWHVSGDGTVARPAVRLAVLNAAAAAVVLSGLRHKTIEPSHPVAETVLDLPDAAVSHEPRRRLRVGVLGPVTVESTGADGTGTPVALRRTASLHLLILLTVHRGGVARDDLATALWPGQPARTANRSLATGLSELRLALQEATGGDVVHRDSTLDGGSRYRLDPAHVDVDLWQFHDLLDAAHSAAGQSRRLALLRQAADLGRGEFAEGLTGKWLPAAREGTARHCIDVLTSLAGAEPDHGTALALLHRAARLAPDNEAVQRDVLRRHAAAGDLDGVRHAYTALLDRCAARSETPEPATVQLYEELHQTVTASTGAARERTPR